MIFTMNMLNLHKHIVSDFQRRTLSAPHRKVPCLHFAKAFASGLIGLGAIGIFFIYKYGTKMVSSPSINLGTCGSVCSDNLFEELMVPGLHNLENNCFLNVVLQALASSPSFLYFINDLLQMSYEMENDDMPLAVTIAKLLEELSSVGSKRKVVNPRKVILALGKYAENFDCARQQDAAEALEHLLSALKEEFIMYALNCESLANVLISSSQKIVSYEEKQQYFLKTWIHYLQGPLVGTVGSFLSCRSCQSRFSTQYEFFSSLPLPVMAASDNHMSFQVTRLTIHECLNQFTAPEWISSFCCQRCSHLNAIKALNQKAADKDIIQKVLDCEDDEKCSCKTLLEEEELAWPVTYVHASKQLRIGHCPKVLCMNLQRGFVNTTGDLVKLRGHIRFPLELDLAPHTGVASDDEKLISCAMSHIEDSKEQMRKTLFHLLPSMYSQPDFYIKTFESCLSRTDAKPCELSDHARFTNGGYKFTSTVKSQELHNFENDGKLGNGIREGNHCMNQSTNTEDINKHKIGSWMDFGSMDSENSVDNSRKQNWIEDERHLNYELISVVEHHGSLQNGHYTVYRRVKISDEALITENKQNPENTSSSESATDSSQSNSQFLWFRISDSVVERVTESDVLGAEASLLFYEKL